MSKTKKDQKRVIKLDGFNGINRLKSHDSKVYAHDSVNFRIKTDGSLEKRCGFRPLTDLGGTIRAFFCGSVLGVDLAYYLVGSSVYTVELKSGDIKELGTIGTSEGEACIFFYRGTLYLLDGKDMYFYTGKEFKLCYGYVPLYGKDWPGIYEGKVNEPRNIINRKIRITYKIVEIDTFFLAVGYDIESVDAIYVNGSPISDKSYTLDNPFKSIFVDDILTIGTIVEVHLTLKNPMQEELSAFCKNVNSILFGASSNDRMFFWGGEDPSKIYCSSFVSKQSLKESQKEYPESDFIYIPEGFDFNVGDGKNKVQGATLHHDRLLIFTDGNVWRANISASGIDDFPVSGVNSDIGCSVYDGVTLGGNDPISIGKNTLWKWTDDTDTLSKSNAYSISLPIDPTISPDEFEHLGLFYSVRENELWLYNRESGNVRIYDLTNDRWFRFEGIFADRIFDAGGQIGFLRGSQIYIFDSNLYKDIDKDGGEHIINASYTASLLDFGTDSPKTLSHIVFRGNTQGSEVSVTVSSDGMADASCSISEESEEEFSLIKRRLPFGRFDQASVTLSASGDTCQTVCGLELHTR